MLVEMTCRSNSRKKELDLKFTSTCSSYLVLQSWMFFGIWFKQKIYNLVWFFYCEKCGGQHSAIFIYAYINTYTNI